MMPRLSRSHRTPAPVLAMLPSSAYCTPTPLSFAAQMPAQLPAAHAGAAFEEFAGGPEALSHKKTENVMVQRYWAATCGAAPGPSWYARVEIRP